MEESIARYMPASKAPPTQVTGTFELAIAGRRLRVELQVPTERTRPTKLLPIFRSVADAVVNVATQTVDADGGAISCKKGCGACCRQLVPISAMEARRLRELVDEMDEEQAAAVRARFASARAQLDQADLLTPLLDVQPRTDAEIGALGLAYFAQQIPCPFLGDESCSIYAERPVACREYLVTSAAAHCAKPTAQDVERVKMPVKVSRALRLLEPSPKPESARWVPLVVALEWASTHPESDPTRSGKEWVSEFFQRLTGTDVGSAQTS